LAYRARTAIKEVIEAKKQEEALYDFTSGDGIRHRVFCIDDAKQIQTIRDEFEKVEQIYIADGHHRAASAVKVGLKRRAENPNYTGTGNYEDKRQSFRPERFSVNSLRRIQMQDPR
jgi:uncharacterized protein (DUF1015 family)